MPYSYSPSKYPAVPKQARHRTVHEKKQEPVKQATKKESGWHKFLKFFGLALIDIAGILLTEFGVGPIVEAVATSELAATIGTTIASSAMEVGFNFLGDAVSGIGINRSSLFINLIPLGGAEGFAKMTKIIKQSRAITKGLVDIERFGIRTVDKFGKETVVKLSKADLNILRKNPSIVQSLFDDSVMDAKKYAYASGETIEEMNKKQFRQMKQQIWNKTNKKLRYRKQYNFIKKMNEVSDNDFWKINKFYNSWDEGVGFKFYNSDKSRSNMLRLRKRFKQVDEIKSKIEPFWKATFDRERYFNLKGTPQWLMRKLHIGKKSTTSAEKEMTVSFDKEVADGLSKMNAYSFRDRLSVASRVFMSWVMLTRFINPATAIRGGTRAIIKGAKKVYGRLEERSIQEIEKTEIIGTKMVKNRKIYRRMRVNYVDEFGNHRWRYDRVQIKPEGWTEFREENIYHTERAKVKGGFFQGVDRIKAGTRKIKKTISHPISGRAGKVLSRIGEKIGMFPLVSRWLDSFSIISTVPDITRLKEIGGHLQIFFQPEATQGPSNPGGKKPITTNWVGPREIAEFESSPGTYYLDHFAYGRDWYNVGGKAASPLEIQRYAWAGMKAFRRIGGRNGLKNAEKMLAKWNELTWNEFANKSGKIFMLEAGRLTGFGSLLNPVLTSLYGGHSFVEGLKSTMDRYVSTTERRYRRLHYHYNNKRGKHWKRIKSVF